ncbi:MAG: chloride channel protein [Candidatus Thorarchaeota archaeon]|nr:chloride channel protein [Candidatus Thorarchaeota archaeon]
MNLANEESSYPTPARPLKEIFHFSHFTHLYRIYVPAAILTGIVCGLFMVLFALLVDFLITILSWIPLFVAPLLGGLFSGAMIYFGAREVEGSGISKAIELTHNPAEIHPRTAVTKLLATSVSIGSGNPVGQEGPAVLIGASIGNFIGRRLGHKNPSHLRVFLMMGSAAATAAIYKAPLGGTLFAAEAPYKRDAQLGFFVPMVLASITSYLVFGVILGIRPLFDFEASLDFTLAIVPTVILLGLIAGGIAIFFAVFLMQTRNFFKLELPDWADPIAGSFFASVVLFIGAVIFDPSLTLAGLGFNVISHIATSQVPIIVLLMLMMGKLFATSFAVAGRVSGGVLSSSIFVGAMLGAVFGEIFAPAYVPAFIVLGMGAVLAANTNTPVASTVLLLEISQTFDLLIPLVICICVAYLVAGGTSLYEGQKLSREDEGPGFIAMVKTDSLPFSSKASDAVNRVENKAKKHEADVGE